MKRNLLKAKMVEKGKTQSEIAQEIGMSTNSLSRKVNGKREFTASEIRKLIKCLSLDPATYHEIFFT